MCIHFNLYSFMFLYENEREEMKIENFVNMSVSDFIMY